MASILLKSGREASIKRHHPWIFSGAISKVEGNPEPGETVEVFASDRQWLARASYSAGSQIMARMLTTLQDEQVDREFWKQRIQKALDLRTRLGLDSQEGAARLVFSESDGIPGLIADRYRDIIVCQFQSAGAERWKQVLADALAEATGCRGIFERSDSESRQKEGLSPSVGSLYGDEPDELLPISEGALTYQVDVRRGHKTGFYLDQALNRKLVAGLVSGKNVLNAFSYTGGFGVAAAAGGAASVVNVDSSAEVLELAKRNFAANNFNSDQITFVQEDVFNLLRKYRDSRKQFDVIVLDPPKFVASASQLNTGARGYKDINLLAFKLLAPGGILVTFSCSGYVKPDLFQKIVADAAVDAGCNAVIQDFLFQSADHPVALNFPEALYLKGLVCRV